MSISTVCSNARSLIVREGWWHTHGDDGHCILDALYCVIPEGDTTDLYLRAVDQVRRTIGLPPKGRIDHWNDHPDRTRYEILDALAQTAIRTDPIASVYR